MKNQRILAVVGLILMGVSIVLMLAGMFTGAAKGLLLNISLVCFLLALTALFFLNYQRRQQENQDKEED